LEDTGHDSLLQDVDGAVGGTAGDASLTSTDVFTGTSASGNCADPAYCLQGVATP
jgi:hypothetical protein